MITLESKYKNILVTGGAGFIGGTFIRRLFEESSCKIFNLDKLGYASDLTSINILVDQFKGEISQKYEFLNGNLLDKKFLENAFSYSKPDLIIHFAAESHVDRSIDNPFDFIESNFVGTFNLLEVFREYFNNIQKNIKEYIKFIHVSTDEVFGSLGDIGSFSENSPYDPRSPYSASKAASDHLANAWFHTYGLPIITTNCSNNFGPWQFPEKLVPLVINKALNGKDIPIYGDGMNIRDWLYVEDHINALLLIINKGLEGEKYCIGGQAEKTNIEIVEDICRKMTNLNIQDKVNYLDQIIFVKDRLGHDRRYSINPSKMVNELNWKPQFNFDEALDKTIGWYLNNQKWVDFISKKSDYYGQRIGEGI